MAIHPGLHPPNSPQPQGRLSPHQTRAISAWSEQAAASLENLTLSEPATTTDEAAPTGPGPSTPSRSLRGATVSLSIPLDDPVPAETTAPRVKIVGSSTAGTHTQTQPHKTPSVAFRRREPLRRDSLRGREALLKGKDGSRRRQRWENDRLLHNPWVEPPSPTDWSVQPTHTRHDPMPYYLAPLWDVHYARAHRDRVAAAAAAVPTPKHRVPKDLRLKLKHARAARGLLQDIEEDIRGFIRRWNERRTGESEEASSSSDDDEVVFVGRKGQTGTPTMTDGSTRRDRRGEATPTPTRVGCESEKKVFESLEEDRAAGFGRWLVHSIATYYGLHTWSVTVGEPARREAYVGFYPRGRMAGSPGRCSEEAVMQAGEELPRPLWMQV
ncbi:R3H-associated N-terminal domain-containing protein [Aspergillus ambiguus]|uniref:uncharacterized protein n=1 Tax=Aspergillus ambiguus TaxID=176160 RepID=UPI003CCD47C2